MRTEVARWREGYRTWLCDRWVSNVICNIFFLGHGTINVFIGIFHWKLDRQLSK